MSLILFPFYTSQDGKWWVVTSGYRCNICLLYYTFIECGCSRWVGGEKNVLCDLVIREQTSYNLMSNMFIDTLFFVYTSHRNN